MPRQLPWLSQLPRGQGESTSLSTASVAPVYTREPNQEDLVDVNLDPIARNTSPRRKKERPVRTPSTSPPPAPPDVEYMREGYDGDDKYIMVEDELWSTAKLFTQHLHHAEYERFKKLAASRGANVLDALARPVDGRTEQTGSLKMQIEAEKKAKRIKSGLKEATGEDDASSSEDVDFMHDIHLAGLMMGGTIPSRNLSGVSKPHSNTRAAAGLPQSPRNTERKNDATVETRVAESITMSSRKEAERYTPDEDSSTDDDDLDRVPTMSKRRIETSTTLPTAKQRRKDDPRKRSNQHAASSTWEARNASAAYSRTSAKSDSTSDFYQASTASNILVRRRAEREKAEQEQKRRAKSDIEIPTFVI